MKKILVGFIAILVAAVTVYATATTSHRDAPAVNETASIQMLHWFDENQVYIGQRTLDEQRLVCDGQSPEICATGYQSIDGNGSPVGAPVEELFKE